MENNPRNVFSRLGFAQVAGIAASIIISVVALKPLAAEANMQKIIDTAGPSALLLLIYVPQIFFLLAFWLVVRSMPKTDWQKENLNFKTLLQLFLMMYAASSVLNTIGSAISKAAPAGGTEQLDLIEKIESTKLLMGYLIPNVIGPDASGKRRRSFSQPCVLACSTEISHNFFMPPALDCSWDMFIARRAKFCIQLSCICC